MEVHQDVMSQFPFLNGYTHLVLGFSVKDDTSRSAIDDSLREAVKKLTASIPWLGGQVEHLSGPAGSSGTYRPAPWPLNSSPNEIIRVKNCEDLLPPMRQIVLAQAPIKLLDAGILTPWPGLPIPHGIKGPVPVVALQLNYVRGGLLLNVSANHIVMDATAILQLIQLLGTVTAGKEITASDIEQANRDRSRVVPLIKPGEPIKDHSHLRRPPDFIMRQPASPATWCYFKLPLSALQKIKNMVTSSSSSLSSEVSLSENDSMSAFFWQRISAVRIARRSPVLTHETLCKFTRVIDSRMAMGIPFSYMGHMVYHASTRLPMGQVATAPLGHLAQALRRDLNASNNAWAVRSFATFIAHEADKSKLLYGGGANDPNIDLGLTGTVAGMGDAREGHTALPGFGPLLGEPRFFRRPSTTPLTGSISVTMTENGSIPVLLCLPREDIDGLKQDSLWRQYLKHIG